MEQNIAYENQVEPMRVLTPRRRLRNILEDRDYLEETNFNLPPIRSMGEIQTIDSDTIININNQTTEERRTALIDSILNYQNSLENRTLLIEHSSFAVKSYINNLLVRASTTGIVTEENLYTIANIFLYTLVNEPEGIMVTVGDFIRYLNESMTIFNINNMNVKMDLIQEEYKSKANELHENLVKDLDEEKENFKKELEEVRKRNKRTRNYIIGGVLSIVCVCIGLPPLCFFIKRLLNSNGLTSDSNSESLGFLNDFFTKMKNFFFS